MLSTFYFEAVSVTEPDSWRWPASATGWQALTRPGFYVSAVVPQSGPHAYVTFFFSWNNASLCTQGWPKTMLLRLVLNSSQPPKWKGWDCRYVSPCWPIFQVAAGAFKFPPWLPWHASCPGMHGSSWERWAWLTETSLPHMCLFYVPTAAPCVCVPNMMT